MLLLEPLQGNSRRMRYGTHPHLSSTDLSFSLSISLWQLEDDIVARPNYFTTMKNFALQQPLEEWMILEFSQLGFIGESAVSCRLSAGQTHTAGMIFK